MTSLALWVTNPYQNDSLFDPSLPLNRDDCLSGFRALRDKLSCSGCECHTQDIFLRRDAIPGAVLFLEVPAVPLASLLGRWAGKVKTCLLLQECEVILPRNWDVRLHDQFDAVFTWSPGLVDGKKYFLCNFSNPFPSQSFPEAVGEKFCVMIAAHKRRAHPLELYSERERIIRWFEANHHEEFDLYGVGWDRRTFGGAKVFRALNRLTWLTRLTAEPFPSYRGMVAKKRPVMEQYKFSICYENAREIPGYITEKIFDAFFAGSVPVYWGAPDILAHAPKDCFIDRRDFRTHEELYAYMKGMSAVEYAARRQAIRAYLQGPQAREYSDTFFAESLAKAVLK